VAHPEGISELGRNFVTERYSDICAFKFPTLREVKLTAPYLHGRSEKRLIDVLRFCNRSGNINPYSDERMHQLDLTDEEISDLVEFLSSLTRSHLINSRCASELQIWHDGKN
jgi:cytochrome c peroxidase